MWCASPRKGHSSPRARHVVVFTGHKGLGSPSRLTVIVSRTPEVTACGAVTCARRNAHRLASAVNAACVAPIAKTRMQLQMGNCMIAPSLGRAPTGATCETLLHARTAPLGHWQVNSGVARGHVAADNASAATCPRSMPESGPANSAVQSYHVCTHASGRMWHGAVDLQGSAIVRARVEWRSALRPHGRQMDASVYGAAVCESHCVAETHNAHALALASSWWLWAVLLVSCGASACARRRAPRALEIRDSTAFSA